MRRGATPALDLVEKAGVAVRVHEFQHDAEAQSFGLEAASSLGVPTDRVFKTLIVRIDGAFWVVAVVPVDQRVNLKALAGAFGGKKAEMAEPARAETLTGYVVGGISPLAQRRALPTVLHESAMTFETIFVSAGRRGLDIEIAPADLLRLTGARTAALV
jgi:Cys-tRNA(Pro)/Cys-tRNA(Cys) deacylase